MKKDTLEIIGTSQNSKYVKPHKFKETLYWYVRLSDDDPKKTSDSIRNQIDLGKIRAKQWKKNFKLYNEGIQKSWNPNRPILAKLLEEITRDYKEGDAVGFKDQTRLARSPAIIDQWLDIMTKEGIPLLESEGNDLTKSPELTGVKAVIDKSIITKGRKDAKLGRTMKQERQETQFKPPYGYKKQHYLREGIVIKKTWKKDPKKAMDVLLIYKMAETMKEINYTIIGRQFNLSRNGIKKILHNKAYHGIIEYKEGRETITYELEKTVPRIITKKQYNKIQQRIKEEKTMPKPIMSKTTTITGYCRQCQKKTLMKRLNYGTTTDQYEKRYKCKTCKTEQ